MDILLLQIKSNANEDSQLCTVRSMHESLYEALERNGLKPKWISEEKCLSLDSRGDDVFVLPTFSGCVFEHLDALKCRVYGSLAVHTCLEQRERLPKWNHSIYSTSLRGAVICFTGFDYNLRDEKTRLIMYMNGVVSRNFHSDVTHLIAIDRDPSRRKYSAAIREKVPIMSLEWIDEAWKAACSLSCRSFLDEDTIKCYRLKVFSGCVITTSGFSMKDRNRLAHLIEENGGKFVGEMKRSVCTHLVTNKNSGKKYETASAWGTVEVVDETWLTKCIKADARLSTEPFHPTRCFYKCSSPNPSCNPPADLEISSISGSQRQQGMLMGDVTTLSGIGNRIRTSHRVSQNATMRTPIPVSNVSDSIIRTPLEDRRTNMSEINSSPKCKYHENSAGTFDYPPIAPDDYLEGARLYLVGISENSFDKWRRLINSTGASRLAKLDQNVTHVLVGDEFDLNDLSTLLQDMSSSTVIVRSDWLVDCVKSKCFLAPDRYLYDQNSVHHEKSVETRLDALHDKHMENGTKNKSAHISEVATFRNVTLRSDDDLALTVNHYDTEENAPVVMVEKNLSSIQSRKVVEPSTCAKTIITQEIITDQCSECDRPRNSCTKISNSSENFLDPNRKFIPNFDLDAAYSYVNHMESQHTCSVECDSPAVASVSMVGRILDDAVSKTAGKCSTFLESRKDSPSNSVDNVLKKCTNNDSKDSRPENFTVSDNLRKRKMIEERLASLAAINNQRINFATSLNGRTSVDENMYSTELDSKRIRCQTMSSNANEVRHRAPDSAEEYLPVHSSSIRRNSMEIGWEEHYSPDSVVSCHLTISDCERMSGPLEEPRAQTGVVQSKEADNGHYEPEKNLSQGETSVLLNTKADMWNGHRKTVHKENIDSHSSKHLETLRSRSSPNQSDHAKAQSFSRIPSSKSCLTKDLAQDEDRASPKPVPDTEDVVQSRSLPKVVRASYVAKMEMERFSAQKASSSCKSSDLQRTEKKKFLFTTIEEKERLEMMEIISRLGGECSSMNEYDPSCTHLICGKIMRNEKLVSAISNGLWVLEKDYVYDSGEANVWKKESEYECGEPSRMKKRSFPNEISRKLALASRRWRLKLSENVGASGAFSNWRVLMFMSTKRFASLRRLIEFGGGSAYLPSTLKDYDGITHALVGHSPLWNKKEANSLASLGIRCFNMDYIATFLTEDPLHEEDHYHPDYRACLNNLLSGT